MNSTGSEKSSLIVRATASRARFVVVGFTVAMAAITYLDRVCISTMSGDIMHDLSLSEHQMSYAFSAFALAYAIFELPTARWADRRGTRSVLTRIVVWWSMLTMATAAATGYGMLLAVRWLFGMGEAGAWPCVAVTYSRWVPARERGKVQGVFFAGAHLSGALTPMLVIFMMNYLRWRSIFVVFGFVGMAWAIAWHTWYRDDPAQHPAVNEAELAAIVSGRGPPPDHSLRWEYWRQLLGHPNTLPLCLMYVGNSYAYYFCITWLPQYLKEHHRIDKGLVWGLAAGLPLGLSVVGDILGGWTTDYLSRRWGPRIGRSGLGAVAYSLAAVSMVIAVVARRPVPSIIALSLSVALVMFTLGAAWATCIDIGGHHTGVVSATMNTAGNFGAIFSPIVAIEARDHLGGWNAPLLIIAGLFLVGAVCWCFIDPRRAVFGAELSH